MGKKATILHDKLYPIIKTNLDKDNGKAFFILCQRLIGENTSGLFTIDMGERVFFSKIIEAEMFKTCGVDIDLVGSYIAATGCNDAGWFHRNRPIYTLLFLVQKYFQEKKKIKERDFVLLIMNVIIYAGRESNFFKFTTSQKYQNVMQYTINNLSNKFILKRTGSVYQSLVETTAGLIKKYPKLLSSESDEDVFKYIMNCVTRVHNLVKNVFAQFKKNYDSNRYINSLKSTDEEDGRLLDRDNAGSMIEKLSDNTLLSIKSNDVDIRIINIVAKSNQLTVLSMRSAMERIYKNERDDIKVILKELLSVFLIEEKRSADDICSPSYLNTVLKVYRQTHSLSKSIINIKNTLDKILKKNSDDYVSTTRAATKSNFKKATFMYFSLILQRNVCTG